MAMAIAATTPIKKDAPPFETEEESEEKKDNDKEEKEGSNG
jgi:hypothetical protein